MDLQRKSKKKQLKMKFYINEEGNTVFTSDYHRNKGSCCHSNCLHCPFGTTLKNIGVKAIPFNDHNSEIIQSLYEKLYEVKDQFTSQLLGNAFGKSNSTPRKEDLYLLSLKGVPCGLMDYQDERVKSFKLLEQFSDQGITEGYLLGIMTPE